jgi:hypothetical protein
MRRTLGCLLLFLLLSAPAFAESPPSAPQGGGPVAVKAMLSNGSAPTGMPVTITATAGGSTTTYRLITGREGNLLLQLGDGNYQLGAALDDMATPGVDYAASASLAVPSERNITLIFYPSGSVAASVLEKDSVVPGADMHVSCSSDWFDYPMMNSGARAGEAGDYLFRALPAGTCIISASTQTAAGSRQVKVEPGQLQSATVELSPKAMAVPDIMVAFAAIIVIAALAYALVSRMRPAHKEAGKQQKAARAPQDAKPSSRAAKQEARAPQSAYAPSGMDAAGEKARAVLSTLSEREAEIVRFLMASGGKAKRSTMQHKLLIPKTSLLRNLRALERKNIVKLIPFGRNLVAELQRSLFE